MRSGGGGAVTDHAEQQEPKEPSSVAELTTEIVVAYVTRNTIAPADLCDLIGAVSRALNGIGREQAEPAKPEPAVPVRRSIQDEHLTCLVCGKRQKSPSSPSRGRAPAHARCLPQAVRAQARLSHGRTRLLQAAFRDGQARRLGTARSGAITTPPAPQRRVILRWSAARLTAARRQLLSSTIGICCQVCS